MMRLLLIIGAMLVMATQQPSRSPPKNDQPLLPTFKKILVSKHPKFRAQNPATPEKDDNFLRADEAININGDLYGINPKYKGLVKPGSDFFINFEFVNLVPVNVPRPCGSPDCSRNDNVPLTAPFQSEEPASTSTPTTQQANYPPSPPIGTWLPTTTAIPHTATDTEGTPMSPQTEWITNDDEPDSTSTPTTQQANYLPPPPTGTWLPTTTTIPHTETDTEGTPMSPQTEWITNDDEPDSTSTRTTQQANYPPSPPIGTWLPTTTTIPHTETDTEGTPMSPHTEWVTDDDEPDLTSTPTTQQANCLPPPPTGTWLPITTPIPPTATDTEATPLPSHAERITDDDDQETQIPKPDIKVAEEAEGTFTIVFGVTIVIYIVITTVVISFFVRDKQVWFQACSLNIGIPQLQDTRAQLKANGPHFV